MSEPTTTPTPPDDTVEQAPTPEPIVASDKDPLARVPQGLLGGIPLTLQAELGRAQMTIEDMLNFATGQVVELDQPAGAPIRLLANGKLVARGEIVVIDEQFGMRITELVEDH